MIVVTVELWPFGRRENRKVLGQMTIANDGSGSKTIGNYDVKLLGRNGRRMGGSRVAQWPRQAMHVWDLVLQALQLARQGADPRRDAVLDDDSRETRIITEEEARAKWAYGTGPDTLHG